jgi:hypothetical protein
MKEFILAGQVASDVVRSLQGEVRRKKLRLVLDVPKRDVRFWGDANDVTQILLNLLSNAVKFTPRGGRVEVRIAQRQEGLVIHVADTGVGIAPEELSKIFEEFYHVDHPEVGAQQGSGLGLAIVKKIIDGYQGQITVTSRLGHGSQFRVVLPVRSERQILQEFLSEVWTQAREAGKSTGLILCQLKGLKKASSNKPASDRNKEPLTVLERILRGSMRKEDRVFHLSDSTMVAVVFIVDPKLFGSMVQRLESALRGALSNGKLLPFGHLQWRLTWLLAPRHGGSPTQFFHLAEERLKGSWEKT